MLTASGNGIIDPKGQIIEKPCSNGAYFNFVLVTKDPYKDGKRHHIRVSLHTPNQYLAPARNLLIPGAILSIRISELSGKLFESGSVAMTVTTKWKWIEILKVLPDGTRKSYQDV